MRCQKCGLISFDGRKTCSGCGKTVAMPEGIVGTVVDARSPAFLAQPRAHDSETAPKPPPTAPPAPPRTAPAGAAQTGGSVHPAAQNKARKESFEEALAAVPAASLAAVKLPEDAGPAGTAASREPERLRQSEDLFGMEIEVAQDNDTAAVEDDAGSLEDILAGIDLGVELPQEGSATPGDGTGRAPLDLDSLHLNLKLEKDT